MRCADVLLAGLLALGCSTETQAPPPPRGVVLVLLDTLRADRLGCYGYARRPTTPVLDRFAEEAVLFETAISHAPWTIASVTSILSGLPDTRAFVDGGLQRSLVEDLTTGGVRTAAFTEGGYFTDAFGFGRGFETFHEEHYLHGGSIETTFPAALGWLAELADERFFLVVHTYEAHLPYLRTTFADGLPSGRIGERFTEEKHAEVDGGELVPTDAELFYLEALYDGGVRACDDWTGRFLSGLDELGLADETVVIVTSDHGEELGERRFPSFAGDHGHALLDYLVRVPLLVRDPRARIDGGRRVSAQVRSMDLLPTALELLGVAVPADCEGRSLVPLLRGESEPTERAARGGSPERGPDREFLRRAGFKLIRRTEEPEPDSPFAHLPELQLYDLEADPTEERNRALAAAASDGVIRRALLDELERDPAAGPLRPDDLDVPPELAERLRALGYGH